MGWIRLHKKLTEWEWYHDSKMVHLFIHLLINANYEDKKWQGVLVKRGQLITGRLKLASALRFSEREIRTCLNNLKTTNEIAIETTNKYSLITICKYESYQDNKFINDQQNDQHIDQRKSNKRPTNDQQTTTTKEYKNNNNKRIEEERGIFFDFEKMEVVFPSGYRQPLGIDQKESLQRGQLKPYDIVSGLIY